MVVSRIFNYIVVSVAFLFIPSHSIISTTPPHTIPQAHDLRIYGKSFSLSCETNGCHIPQFDETLECKWDHSYVDIYICIYVDGIIQCAPWHKDRGDLISDLPGIAPDTTCKFMENLLCSYSCSCWFYEITLI